MAGDICDCHGSGVGGLGGRFATGIRCVEATRAATRCARHGTPRLIQHPAPPPRRPGQAPSPPTPMSACPRPPHLRGPAPSVWPRPASAWPRPSRHHGHALCLHGHAPLQRGPAHTCSHSRAEHCSFTVQSPCIATSTHHSPLNSQRSGWRMIHAQHTATRSRPTISDIPAVLSFEKSRGRGTEEGWDRVGPSPVTGLCGGGRAALPLA